MSFVVAEPEDDDEEGAGLANSLDIEDSAVAAFDGAGLPSTRHLLNGSAVIPPRLLASVRAVLSGRAIEECWTRVDIDTEASCLSALQHVLEGAGARFRTRLAADEAALLALTTGTRGEVIDQLVEQRGASETEPPPAR